MTEKEENLKKFLALPEAWQSIYLSEEYTERFLTIKTRHNLSEEAHKRFRDVVCGAILDHTPPHVLRTKLQTALGLPDERLNPLFQDIIQKLLSPFQEKPSETPAPSTTPRPEEPPSRTGSPATPSITDHVVQFQERRKQREQQTQPPPANLPATPPTNLPSTPSA